VRGDYTHRDTPTPVVKLNGPGILFRYLATLSSILQILSTVGLTCRELGLNTPAI
jgi:hypothetical protein